MLLTNYVGQTYANATMDCSKHDKPVQIETSHDHMMHQAEANDANNHHEMNSHDCCETTCHCALSSCSSITILLTQFENPSVGPANDHQFVFSEGNPVSSIKTLYRPPINA